MIQIEPMPLVKVIRYLVFHTQKIKPTVTVSIAYWGTKHTVDCRSWCVWWDVIKWYYAFKRMYHHDTRRYA